jgi:gluconolactonase
MDRRQALALIAAALAAPAHAGRTHRPRLTPDAFQPVLEGIDGAEGLATAPDGMLAFSCSNAAVGLRAPDGTVRYLGEPIATGGLAFDPQGRVIAASVGALHGREGPLRRIDPATGAVEVLAAELEGRRLVTSNCPVVARDGTIWCSHTGWSLGNIGTTATEGFIYCITPDGRARIVARGLRGVNGLALGRGDRQLHAAMTAEGRVRVWDRLDDGALRPAGFAGPPLGAVVPDQMAAAIRTMPAAQRGATGYCDGLAFDRAGTLYVTLPFANKVVAITPTGRLSTLVHDPAGRRVRFPTNLAFGGPDGRDLFVVSRDAGMIVRARMPLAGLPAANWPA